MRGSFQQLFGRVGPDDEIHPAKTIEKIAQKFGKLKALIGLRQAANDTIEETSHWNLESKVNLDEALKASGVITISEIARRYSSSYKRIIKRCHVRDDTEYYVVNGILVDQGNAISDEERAHLQKLIDVYEAKC